MFLPWSLIPLPNLLGLAAFYCIFERLVNKLFKQFTTARRILNGNDNDGRRHGLKLGRKYNIIQLQFKSKSQFSMSVSPSVICICLCWNVLFIFISCFRITISQTWWLKWGNLIHYDVLLFFLLTKYQYMYIHVYPELCQCRDILSMTCPFVMKKMMMTLFTENVSCLCHMDMSSCHVTKNWEMDNVPTLDAIVVEIYFDALYFGSIVELLM